MLPKPRQFNNLMHKCRCEIYKFNFVSKTKPRQINYLINKTKRNC